MSGQPRILLVDDEAAITENLIPLLQHAGFQVEAAANGVVGLQKLSAFAPDLIVLDVLMPAMDGREMLRQMRQAGNWTPVILLTQVGASIERAMALEEGADDYLNKPFDPYELIARIRSVLRRVHSGQIPLTSAQRLASGDVLLERSSRRVKVRR